MTNCLPYRLREIDRFIKSLNKIPRTYLSQAVVPSLYENNVIPVKERSLPRKVRLARNLLFCFVLPGFNTKF